MTGPLLLAYINLNHYSKRQALMNIARVVLWELEFLSNIILSLLMIIARLVQNSF